MKPQYVGPVILTLARKDEKGREVGAFKVPFSSVEQAEKYIAEIKRIGKALRSNVERVFRIEPMPPAKASDYAMPHGKSAQTAKL